MIKNLENNENRFQLINGFIMGTQYIEIKCINYRKKQRIMTNKETKKLKKLGYGITKFKLLNSDRIREVICYGMHTNINSTTRKFCLPTNLIFEPLTVFNLNYLYGCMSTLDLTYCYSPMIHEPILERFLI